MAPEVVRGKGREYHSCEVHSGFQESAWRPRICEPVAAHRIARLTVSAGPGSKLARAPVDVESAIQKQALRRRVLYVCGSLVRIQRSAELQIRSALPHLPRTVSIPASTKSRLEGGSLPTRSVVPQRADPIRVGTEVPGAFTPPNAIFMQKADPL